MSSPKGPDYTGPLPYVAFEKTLDNDNGLVRVVVTKDGLVAERALGRDALGTWSWRGINGGMDYEEAEALLGFLEIALQSSHSWMQMYREQEGVPF